MKTCTKCNKEKELTEFHKKRNGVRSDCKECRYAEYRTNPLAAKLRARKHYYSNYEKSRIQNKEWAIRNREKMNQFKYDWRENNEEKRKAHGAVSNALRSGKLKKLPCVNCGNQLSHAHHPDYTKKLKVIWVCAKHHSLIHHPSKIYV